MKYTRLITRKRLIFPLVSLLVLFGACEEETGREGTPALPCEADTRDTLYGSWQLPPENEVPSLSAYCIDSVCQFFNLELSLDQSYSLSYQIIDPYPNTAPPTVTTLQENGTFSFDCEEEGFNTRLNAFHYFNGTLGLQPNQSEAYSFYVRWTGHDGLILHYPSSEGETHVPILWKN